MASYFSRMGQTIHNCHNKYIKSSHVLEGFPGGSGSKEFACNTGDPGSIPELGRCPEEGNSYSLPYSCQENPMDRGTWQATVHGVAKNQTGLSN